MQKYRIIHDEKYTESITEFEAESLTAAAERFTSVVRYKLPRMSKGEELSLFWFSGRNGWEFRCAYKV